MSPATSPSLSTRGLLSPTPSRRLASGPLAATLTGEAGPLVVALHGLAESQRYWGQVVKQLAPTHRVLTVDLLGFGRSPWPDLGYSARVHAQAVSHTLAQAGLTDEPVVLLAHQTGVPIAMRLAARSSDHVQGLVALGTPWYRSPHEARRALAAPSWLSRWLLEHRARARFLCRAFCGGRPVVPRVARWITPDQVPSEVVEDAFLHSWTSLSQTLDTCWLNAALPEAYGDFPVPMLAVHGDDDHAAPVENLLDATGRRRWLNVQVAPTLGHNLAWEAPGLVKAAVIEMSSRPSSHRPARALPRAEQGQDTALTVSEAAQLVRSHRRTVLSWIANEALPASRHGNRWMVMRSDLLCHALGLDTDHDALLAQPWLTPAQAAAYLGISHATLARRLNTGLPSHHVGGRRVFLASELAPFI
ncbi:MAG: alpha/beta fold hydrolase [Acidimicrobiales bacterium]